MPIAVFWVEMSIAAFWVVMSIALLWLHYCVQVVGRYCHFGGTSM